MSLSRPAANCVDVPFAVPRTLESPAQVALEDYARVLSNAAAAEARLTDTGAVAGVHVCGAASGVSTAMARDIEDFAAELVATSSGGGLGWS